MPRPEGYDKPRKPEATPPAIDPDAKPVSAKELATDGPHDGDTLKHRSDPNEIDIERDAIMKTRQARDGLGEQGHDEARPETLLPPD